VSKIMRKDAKKMLGNVPREYEFKCQDGRMLKNIQDLEEALKSMSEETFMFHSNTEKTDFANWVRDVIGDEKLARDLAKSSQKGQAAKSVNSRIAFLSSKLN